MGKPRLVKPIKSFAVKQRTIVRRDVSEHFTSDTGELQFSLVGMSPRWLVIGENTGVILGEAPSIAHNVQYMVSVKVSNGEGEIIEHFLLKVTAENFMSSMTSAVLNLTLNKKKYDLVNRHPMTHDVLQYIFEYYRESKYWAIFEGLIRENASIMNIKVSDKMQYRDFKKVILAKNPQIERHLRDQLGVDHILVEAEMRNEEMRNLFRQGSQPQGVYPRQVWNYMGAPSLHNWSHVKTVLHECVESVIDRYEHVHEQALQQHHLHVPEPSPYPKDWTKRDK